MSDDERESTDKVQPPAGGKATRAKSIPAKKAAPRGRTTKRPADEQPELKVAPKIRKTDADQEASNSAGAKAKAPPRNRQAPPVDDDDGESAHDGDTEDSDDEDRPEEEDEWDAAALAAAKKAKKHNEKMQAKLLEGVSAPYNSPVE